MAETPDWSHKNYLVIDDFSIVHRMLRDMLRKFGAASIDTVKNGADAIALLGKKQYDVVLCDYNFSDGPNGQQILEEARHRDLVGPACIWMMVSSEKAVEIVTGAAEQAPDGYILKPLTESLLLSRLNRAWDRKQAFVEIDRAYAARNFRKAIELCDQRLATDRIHAADLMRMKANLLMKCGDIKDARTVYEQALSIRDQVWAKTGLAKLHYVNGQYGPARYLLYEVIATNPSYLDAYDYLAQTLQKLEEPEEALQVLENAAKLSPYSVVRQKNLGELAFKLGKIAMAEQAFQMSIAVGENSVFRTADAYLGLARIYTSRKMKEQALQVLDEVRQTFDNEYVSVRARIAEGLVYVAFGQQDQALQLAQEIRARIAETRLALGAETAQELAKLPFPPAAAHAQTPAAPVKSPVAKPQPAVAPAAQAPAKAAPVPQDERSAAHIPAQAAANPAAARAGTSSAQTGAPVPGASAKGDLPEKARLLFNRANVLLQYMQRNGYNAVSAEETRAVLKRMEKTIPGDPRIVELQTMLNAMSPA